MSHIALFLFMEKPGLSFPDIFNKPKELLGFYRFTANESFGAEDLKISIIEDTKRLSDESNDAGFLVIHDTTENKIPAKALNIEEFKASKGFFAHSSSVVKAERCQVLFRRGKVPGPISCRKKPRCPGFGGGIKPARSRKTGEFS
jgi:hypothetical protein